MFRVPQNLDIARVESGGNYSTIMPCWGLWF